MRVNPPALGTGGAIGEERNGSAANGDCIIRVNSPGALAWGEGGGASGNEDGTTGLLDGGAEDVRGGAGAAGVWANTRVASPSSG
ncbi:MAG TPA: hypothetical protein VMR62_14125 [Bryobacteraceae bacterium]|jgi:hypothetical protein|nr:hypothetical protein [Bryobacteraceae bacterium]